MMGEVLFGRADRTRHTVDRLLTHTRHSGFPSPQISGIKWGMREQKITLGQMQQSVVTGVLVYCSDYRVQPLHCHQRGPLIG